MYLIENSLNFITNFSKITVNYIITKKKRFFKTVFNKRKNNFNFGFDGKKLAKIHKALRLTIRSISVSEGQLSSAFVLFSESVSRGGAPSPLFVSVIMNDIKSLEHPTLKVGLRSVDVSALTAQHPMSFVKNVILAELYFASISRIFQKILPLFSYSIEWD